MDYFWRNKGFTYDPSKDYFLSQYQLILIAAIIIIGILLWLLIRKLSQPKQRLMFKILAIILLILEVLRYLNFYLYYTHNWFGSLSFHLCSFGVYIAIATAFFQKKWLFDSLVVFAIIGAPLALIIPSGILPWYNEYSFMVLQSFLSHLLLTWIFIVGYKLKLWTPDIKKYWITIVAVTTAYIIAYIASTINYNYSLGGHPNFIWTRYADPTFPIISNWPHPWYVIFMCGLLLVVGFLSLLLFQVLSNKRAKIHNTMK